MSRLQTLEPGPLPLSAHPLRRLTGLLCHIHRSTPPPPVRLALVTQESFIPWKLITRCPIKVRFHECRLWTHSLAGRKGLSPGIETWDRPPWGPPSFHVPGWAILRSALDMCSYKANKMWPPDLWKLREDPRSPPWRTRVTWVTRCLAAV